MDLEKIRQWMYYLLIGIISLISLTFLPMIGTKANLGWNLPNTPVGWIVWIATKLIVATLNVLIFHCFMLQAKLNIKDDVKYIEAKTILQTITNDEAFTPLAPNVWTRKQYSQKGITIFITTALSTIALTQALLTFDWIAMLTYLFTIVMGLIFGVMQMKTAEDYWTDEFWQYAQKIKRDSEMAKEKHLNKDNDTSSNIGRIDILESSDCVSNISNCDKSVVVDNNFCDYRFLGRSIHSSSSITDCTNIINQTSD